MLLAPSVYLLLGVPRDSERVAAVARHEYFNISMVL